MKRFKICTISLDYRLRGDKPWAKDTAFTEARQKILSALPEKPDLFLLPEAFLTGLTEESLKNSDTYEKKDSLIYANFSELARQCNSYIAAPLLTQDKEGRHNSTVLFDRQGEVVFTYHKVYPTNEELNADILPGTPAPACYDTDCGRIGFAICFDLQFQPLFKHYYNQGIELLLFSSYFPGGFILRSLAFQYSFFIVSSHSQGEESVFIDNYGRETARTGLFSLALSQTLNLDSAVLPINLNLEKVKLCKEKYGTDNIDVEIQRPEGKLILTSVNDKITVPELICEFGLITPDEFFNHRHLC